MANFFIDRPVFAWVLAFFVMLGGLIALQVLPVERYPDIAPPQVQITAVYPGASAEAVEQTVTQVIEQQLKGLDGLRYIKSSSDSNGTGSITVTFNTGTDPDIAQVQVQNKLSLADPLLPDAVKRQGVRVSKGSSSTLMIAGLISPNGTFNRADLSDYLATNILDPVSRVSGVGSTTLYGAKYAMRIWMDPKKLDQYHLSPLDITNTIQNQNSQVSAGMLGGTPASDTQEYTATVTLQSLKTTPEEFRKMPISTTASGATITLGDVATVEIGAESYDFVSNYNGSPAAGLAVSLANGANALDTTDGVKELINGLSVDMPADMEIVYPYETTPFVAASISEVEHTLVVAVILVFIVILIFLQSLRATLPPMIAIPVVLLGVLGVMQLAGFSINMLTLFAMVLAIGLLVDDAIVVVENVERVMEEDGLDADAATRKSMGEIVGALIGIVLVLSAVFVPMAFFSGSTGVIYRQFSLTIIAAMVLSMLTAIILTPTICTHVLQHKKKDTFFSKPAAWFNAGFKTLTDGYVWVVGQMIRMRWLFLLMYAVLAVFTVKAFVALPTAFLPDEDQGIALAMAQLPGDSSVQRTDAYLSEMSNLVLSTESDIVNSAFTVAGFGLAGNGSNQGIAFISTKPWDDRPLKSQSTFAISERLNAGLRRNQHGFGMVLVPPAIPELGMVSGFDVYIQDTAGAGRAALNQAMGQILGAASADKTLVGVRPNEQGAKSTYNIHLDYKKLQAHGITTNAVTTLMNIALGSTYVNDYLDRGRIKRVILQGVTDARMQPEDIGKWKVRNSSGEMIPLDEIMTANWSVAQPQLNRFNGLPAVNIQGMAAPGYSSGDAMNEVENIVSTLPGHFSSSWSGTSWEERQATGQASLLYLLSGIFIFLCLAALYESWTVPVAVLLVAPIGVLGAVTLVGFRGMNNDVFFQVGVLTTVGLAAKNAILIVEFAKNLEEKQGMSIITAALSAARMRLRPILMTSFAFGLGVLPLAVATGAGAGARLSIGTAVLGGMIASTFLGTFFTPLFYVTVRQARELFYSKTKPKKTPQEKIPTAS